MLGLITLLVIIAPSLVFWHLNRPAKETDEERFVRLVAQMSGHTKEQVRSIMTWWGLRYGSPLNDWSHQGARDLADEIMNET
jgi:hypothetical protein